MPRALGLDVIVQPSSIGPFGFGTSVRASNGSTALPGAFSITNFFARNAEEVAIIQEGGRKIAMDMLSMPGFISMVSAVVGDCPDDHQRLGKPGILSAPPDETGGEHRSMVSHYFTSEFGQGGMTGSMGSRGRLNPRRVRCPGCDKMTPVEAPQQKCSCGAVLPDPLAYW